MRQSLILLTVVLSVVAYSAIGAAESITLTNPGFELPALGKIGGGFDVVGKDVPGWTNGASGTYADTGIENTVAKTGSCSAYMWDKDPSGGSMFQTTGHVAVAGESYDLTYWGLRQGGFETLNASLFYLDALGARQQLATAMTKPDAANVWQQYTLSVDATTASVAVGRLIGVSFSAAASYPCLDDVALSFTAAAVPEPASIVLVATGLLGLLAYAWRKRK